MKNRYVMMFAVLVFTLFVTACASPPTAEMNAATNAVVLAENTPNAVNFAPHTLMRARDALTMMHSEADARRFDAARAFAAEAISLADRAITEGNTGAEWARQEAATLIGGLGLPIEETAVALNSAEQAGVGNLDYNALAWDLFAARENYNGAQLSFAESDYGQAIAQGQNARAIISGINAAINNAVQLAMLK